MGYQLTSKDLRALRTASNVSFHYYPADENGYLDRDGDWKAYIRASKDNPAFTSDPFAPREIQHDIEVDAGIRGFAPKDVEWRACFDMIHGSPYHHAWMTMARCFKPGDNLFLDWAPDAGRTNVLDRESGGELHADRLYIWARNPEKKRDLCFFLRQSTCLDNTARMIRHTGSV